MDDNLLRLTIEFRHAIEVVCHSEYDLPNLLKSFPKGCCGYASDLLQRFLHERGIETLYITAEEKETDFSHVWLQTLDDNTIIDITMDQYFSNNPVYVGPLDIFHNRFTITSRTPFIYPTKDPLFLGTTKSFDLDKDDVYKFILKTLKEELS